MIKTYTRYKVALTSDNTLIKSNTLSRVSKLQPRSFLKTLLNNLFANNIIFSKQNELV